MRKPLDELYISWLYGQIANPRVHNSSRSYWKLIRQVYTKEFVWFVPNDDNRVEDGRALRDEFLDDEGLDEVDEEWLELGCSVLEMLIALARRLAFEADGEPRLWFWHLLKNLGLDACNDRSNYDQNGVDDVLESVIWRTYDPTGRGGLFPLECPYKDQRRTEIWDQMSSYLLEHRM
jgi:hypothetical protein